MQVCRREGFLCLPEVLREVLATASGVLQELSQTNLQHLGAPAVYVLNGDLDHYHQLLLQPNMLRPHGMAWHALFKVLACAPVRELYA